MTRFLKTAFLAAIAFVFSSTGAVAQQYQTFDNTQDGRYSGRILYYSVPKIEHVPVTAAGDTGPILNITDVVTSPTFTVTVTPAMQPTEPRELFIAQTDDTGTSLSVVYTVTYTIWDGTKTTLSVTLTGDDSVAFPEQVIKIDSLSYVATNGDASDKLMVGWRGFYVPGAHLGSVTNILQEVVNGVQPTTAGTVNSNFAYLPNSISADQSFSLLVRTTVNGKTIIPRGAIGNTYTTPSYGP